MNDNLMTIDNMMFVGTAPAAKPASKSNTLDKATEFSYVQVQDDVQPTLNNPELKTADNNCTTNNDKPPKTPAEDFNSTLRKAETTNTTPQKQEKTKKQNSSPQTTDEPNIAQSALTQKSNTIQAGKENSSTTAHIKSNVNNELIQLLAGLNANKSSKVIKEIAQPGKINSFVKSNKNELNLDTTSIDSSKNQVELKTILAEPSKGKPESKTTLSLDAPKNQSEPKIALPNTPKGNTVNNIQTNQSDKTANKISVTNVTDEPIKTSDTKNLNEQKLESLNNTTIATEKTAKADTLSVINGKNIPASKDQKSTPENYVDNNKITNTNELRTITDKSADADNQKTPDLNIKFPSVKAQPSESQPVGINSEKSIQITEKPLDSKKAAPEILSESSINNSKESTPAGNKISEDSTTQKELNITEVQVSTKQTKAQGGSTANNSSNSSSGQTISNDTPEPPATEQSTNFVESAKTAQPMAQRLPSDVSVDISKQILDSIQNSSIQQKQNQQITVHLNPPELGKVLIKFQEQDGEITGLLEATKSETRIEIQQAIPQIMRSLQDSGIQIRRVEVVLSEDKQPEQEALKDQSLSNGWTFQEGSSNSNTGGNNPNTSGINEWLTNNYRSHNTSNLQETLIADGSINMLV